MTVFALLLLVPPLLRTKRSDAVDRAGANISIARERLRELESERDASRLSSEEFRHTRGELEVELLTDLAGADPQTAAPGGRWVAVAVALMVPALALGLYHYTGHRQAVTYSQADVQPDQGAEPAPSMEEIVARIKRRLQDEPDSAEGWAILGNVYTHMEQFSDAEAAYKKALGLAGENPDLMVIYAEALGRANGNSLAGEPRRLAEQALALDPNNERGLWLAGFAALQEDDHASTLQHWRLLLSSAEPGSESYRLVQTMLAQVPGGADIDSEPIETVQPAQTTALTVNVDLAPALSKEADPGDTLFIFARAVSGPPMPLAVVTATAKDLPISVTLDDSSAMMPGMQLSGFDQVMVGARLSKHGQAIAQPGDLQGLVGPIKTDTDDPVEITIDEKVP